MHAKNEEGIRTSGLFTMNKVPLRFHQLFSLLSVVPIGAHTSIYLRTKVTLDMLVLPKSSFLLFARKFTTFDLFRLF